MRGAGVPTRAGRLFYGVMMAAGLAVGGLQMYHVHAGLLTDYGADLFGTAWVYGSTRLGWTFFQRGRTMAAGPAALIVLTLCIFWEFGQRSHLVPGRYDPWDLLTYAIAASGCWVADRRLPFVSPST